MQNGIRNKEIVKHLFRVFENVEDTIYSSNFHMEDINYHLEILHKAGYLHGELPVYSATKSTYSYQQGALKLSWTGHNLNDELLGRKKFANS